MGGWRPVVFEEGKVEKTERIGHLEKLPQKKDELGKVKG